MSDESGDEGTSGNANAQVDQRIGGARSVDMTAEMQLQMQELTRMRDELTRLSAETRAQGAPSRFYIYVPRERQVQVFSGDGSQDGRSVEEFIDEVERVLRSREQSPEERSDYILSLLRGPALEEARFCMGGQSVGPSFLFSYLRNAFGEKRNSTQLLQTFYNREQAVGEDLRDYSHALSQIMSSILKQSTDAIPNEKVVLREQFIEGLRDTALRRELRKLVREKPDSSLLDVRSEALLWEMEDGRSQRSRVVRTHHVLSDISVTHCSTRSSNNGEATTLETVQKAVVEQGKQLADLTKTLADLASAVSELSKRSLVSTFQEPRPRPKYQPRFTPDGQPICYKCRGVGHIAKNCPQTQVSPSSPRPGRSAVQENSSPRLS